MKHTPEIKLIVKHSPTEIEVILRDGGSFFVEVHPSQDATKSLDVWITLEVGHGKALENKSRFLPKN